MATVVDISNVNGSVDWSRLARSGVQGAYIKLSEGVTFDDPDSYTHARGADRAGLPFGYYHFAHPEHNSPEAEAQHVLRRLSGRKPKPAFRLVLDFEHGSAQASYGDWAHSFSQTIRALLGHFPIFYSYGPYIQGLKLAKPVGSGLWLAAYGRNDGAEHPFDTPAPWKRVLMHQFSSNCRVGGCAHPVDLSHIRSLRTLRVPTADGL
jgi:GH25 family lysozyme M1 (1,4-beta-N-acetylmuramidase)